MRLFFIPLLTIPFLHGCIAMEGVHNVIVNSKHKYIELTTGEIANLRAFFDDSGSISIYPNASTFIEAKSDKNAGSLSTDRKITGLNSVDYERKSIGMPFPPTNDTIYAEYKVPAGKPFVVSLSFKTVQSYGSNNVYFTCKRRFFKVSLESNKNYGVRPTIMNKRCSYQFFEYEDNGRETPVKSFQMLR